MTKAAIADTSRVSTVEQVVTIREFVKTTGKFIRSMASGKFPR